MASTPNGQDMAGSRVDEEGSVLAKSQGSNRGQDDSGDLLTDRHLLTTCHIASKAKTKRSPSVSGQLSTKFTISALSKLIQHPNRPHITLPIKFPTTPTMHGGGCKRLRCAGDEKRRASCHHSADPCTSVRDKGCHKQTVLATRAHKRTQHLWSGRMDVGDRWAGESRRADKTSIRNPRLGCNLYSSKHQARHMRRALEGSVRQAVGFDQGGWRCLSSSMTTSALLHTDREELGYKSCRSSPALQLQ
ncbi:hypothetical protein BDZ97DRAFT_1929517 [Flammula alnicola]|nr:hypothetical protein BDZ97DRAFT_1929517 [Flammula alnicola]